MQPTLMGLIWLALAFLPSVRAARKSIVLPPDHAMAELKAGAGVEAVRANCVACHSTDYIVRQPAMDAKQWESEVNKMIKVFGAPISPEDAKTIAAYLVSAYGSAPAAAPPTKDR
ncbi:MAG TPA: cytochrome C [Terriglobia bacterium]|nr:cytochrome C [Terriglobia bacterium]